MDIASNDDIYQIRLTRERCSQICYPYPKKTKGG